MHGSPNSTPRRAAPVDTAWQALAAANARYARQAQERTARELAQAKELARVQRQVAARAAAQQRLSIGQAARAAKASAAARLGLPTDSVASALATTASPSTGLAPLAALPARTSRQREKAILAPAQQPEAVATAATEETAPTDLAGTTAARRATPRQVIVAAPEARASSRPQLESRRGKDEKPEASATRYTIRPGDNLTKLAREQGVSIAQLKTWNKLTTENVVAGQQLRLDAPANATALPMAAAPAAPAPRTHPAAVGPPLETHTVQPGDTLFSIARHFGLSLAELKRLNHLASDQVKLKPGQKLVVHG